MTEGVPPGDRWVREGAAKHTNAAEHGHALSYRRGIDGDDPVTGFLPWGRRLLLSLSSDDAWEAPQVCQSPRDGVTRTLVPGDPGRMGAAQTHQVQRVELDLQTALPT